MAATATERIPNDIFRERYLVLRERGVSAADVAAWTGWYRPDGRPDDSRLLRHLGLRPWTSGSGNEWTQTTLRYDVAVELCDALGVDYYEAGV